jgi:hypothetical protein
MPRCGENVDSRFEAGVGGCPLPTQGTFQTGHPPAARGLLPTLKGDFQGSCFPSGEGRTATSLKDVVWVMFGRADPSGPYLALIQPED